MNYFLLFLLFEALFVFAILTVYLLKKLVDQANLEMPAGSGIKVLRRFLSAELTKYESSQISQEDNPQDESEFSEETERQRTILSLRAQILKNELEALPVRHDAARYYEKLTEGMRQIPILDKLCSIQEIQMHTSASEPALGDDQLAEFQHEGQPTDVNLLHNLMADQSRTIEILRQAIIEPELDEEIRIRIQRAVADLEYQLNELQQLLVGLELENQVLRSQQPEIISVEDEPSVYAQESEPEQLFKEIPVQTDLLEKEVHSVEIESKRVLKKIDKLVSNRDFARELKALVHRLMAGNRELYTCVAVMKKEHSNKH